MRGDPSPLRSSQQCVSLPLESLAGTGIFTVIWSSLPVASGNLSPLRSSPQVVEPAPAAIGRGGDPSVQIQDGFPIKNVGNEADEGKFPLHDVGLLTPLVIPAVCGGYPSEKDQDGCLIHNVENDADGERFAMTRLTNERALLVFRTCKFPITPRLLNVSSQICQPSLTFFLFTDVAPLLLSGSQGGCHFSPELR